MELNLILILNICKWLVNTSLYTVALDHKIKTTRNEKLIWWGVKQQLFSRNFINININFHPNQKLEFIIIQVLFWEFINSIRSLNIYHLLNVPSLRYPSVALYGHMFPEAPRIRSAFRTSKDEGNWWGSLISWSLYWKGKSFLEDTAQTWFTFYLF